MIGETISHYKILEKLGEGGMGVVYKAHDTKLDRLVALKFLPQQITVSEEEKARFLQEAKAISSLNHPNIATIHDIDEADGQKFLVLEYIPGGTLKSKLKYLKSEDKEFSLAEVLDYGIQAAEALAHAHRHGIIHRDVKTDNLMLTDEGKLKLTDFGLAKLRGSAQVTKTGTTVGTAAYMSPEQIRGEEIDQRSDIFSLGVVLYELLTLHLPFRGEFETALSYSILNENPPPVKSLRKDAPATLEKIIERCLEKEKTKRYQSAEEVIDELRRLQEGRTAPKRNRPIVQRIVVSAAILFILVAMYLFWSSKQPSIVSSLTNQEKSIVVLPFENISPDKENEYFSDGLTDEIITELSRIKGLDVKSRHASMAFKGKNKKISEIAGEVNVRFVLEGSVRKEGNDLRIAAKLIDARNDRNLWAETFPGTLKDVFDMQEQVSRSIVNALSIELSPEESKGISERPIDNVQAYDFYLKARRELQNWDVPSYDRAKKYLNAGLDIVGPNPVLYGTMAYLYWNYANLGIRIDESLVNAEEYVRKAFELDPRSPQAHLALGSIYQNMRPDMRKSIFHMKAVLETNPHDYDALMLLTVEYGVIGKMVSAHKYADNLIRLDTASVGLWNGFLAFYEGRFNTAVDPLLEAFRRDPTNDFYLIFNPLVLAYNGRIDEAKSVIDTHAKTEPTNTWQALARVLRYALDNNQVGMWKIVMTPEWLKSFKTDCQNSQFVSQIYAMTGHKREALDWLENAIDRGFINYPLIAEHDPFFRKFKDDERFKKLVQRMKIEFENFKD